MSVFMYIQSPSSPFILCTSTVFLPFVHIFTFLFIAILSRLASKMPRQILFVTYKLVIVQVLIKIEHLIVNQIYVVIWLREVSSKCEPQHHQDRMVAGHQTSTSALSEPPLMEVGLQIFDRQLFVVPRVSS